ncbi:Vga family ABC-F type ribosomal protection protein [Oceanobacillus kapialis]|uniref:Vga family ABC-F type ribosomal protection protein n=1 Tax=Oceanobacillus kapialis TaxID=481353 RepID=A0ABW5Q558_9BACI
MRLIEAHDVSIDARERRLVEIEHLIIHAQDRIGLVGKNGSGKTSLLKVLAGKKAPDNGVVTINTSITFIPQLKRTNTVKSGGEITQEYINEALAQKAELILADEPTTNLDTQHIEKLEAQLKRRHDAMVLISHDRTFLDALCNKIWELDEGTLTAYKGNYSDYAAQKELEIEQQQQAYAQYEKKKKQLEEALELKEQKAQRATKKPKQTSNSEAKITGAKPYFANKQKKLRKTAKAIETRLEKLEKVEKVKEIAPIKMHLPNEDRIRNRVILRAEEISAKVGSRILWKDVSFTVSGGDKVAIIGPNGSGKTTLVKKILDGARGVTKAPAMKIGYFSQNLDILDKQKSILDNVSNTSNQEETLNRTVLARLRFFREDVYKKVDVLSGGERVKVALAKLLLSDINTLILDEPTNFLDIEAVEALEKLLLEYEGTVIFVSHDRRFVEHLASRIFSIEDSSLRIIEGGYQAYKHDNPTEPPSKVEEELFIIETKLTEILSRLSIEPSEELETSFQRLSQQKRELKNKL